jgi:hypothetical protein
MRQISREDIRRVVVLLAGSRTGSSFLFSALKSLGRFIAPTGEETPFYRLHGLGVFDGPGYCDEIRHIPSKTQLDSIFATLRADLGVLSSNCSPETVAEKFFERLNLQWPGAMSAEERRRRTPAFIRKLTASQNDWREVYLNWIRELAEDGFPVHTAPYSASERYPGFLPLIEEPPYLHPEPKSPLTLEQAAEFPLLLKTSTNVYRTEFLRALFPRAKFRWIILRRNPAATIGALMDGWLSGGFHSHDLKNFMKLSIQGYSESQPLGDRYWKFDMPPGWQDYASSTLAEVCAFQWRSAYETLAAFRENLDDAIDVSYEELISASGQNRLRELIEFCRTEARPEDSWDPRAPVAAVSKPRAGKWKKHAGAIAALIERENVRRLARQLEYEPSQMEHWP